jgi:hypothetical protein
VISVGTLLDSSHSCPLGKDTVQYARGLPTFRGMLLFTLLLSYGHVDCEAPNDKSDESWI